MPTTYFIELTIKKGGILGKNKLLFYVTLRTEFKKKSLLFTSSDLKKDENVSIKVKNGKVPNPLTAGPAGTGFHSYAFYRAKAAIDNWEIDLADTSAGLKDMWMVVRYTASTP
jgi:hypothetical protein